MTTNKQILIWW